MRAPATTSPGAALLPLRLFLGVTFIYAGVQKLSDPGFLHPGAPTYIGTQLHGFANGTPGGFLLRAFAIPHPQLAGVGVAILEIMIGLLTTAGLLTRIAAIGGLGLNLVLFLTNSWNAYPYFLGSDIVFVFGWLPFVLTGPSGQPALDHSLDRLRHSPRLRLGNEPALSRRDVLVRTVGLTGFAALGIAGASALAKGRYTGGAKALGSRTGTAPAKPATTTPSSPSHTSTPSGVPSNAVKLAPSSQLPSGQGATYTDPSDGSTDIVIRDSSGKLAAFSAVCTHAGCTVGYESGQLVCPCHGGVYDATTGAVVSGPPPSGLPKRKITESGGYLYAIPS